MFGLSSHTATKTWRQPVGGDELVVHEADGFILRFEPYPETSAPQPEREWRYGEPLWANGMTADDIDESDPQPGRDDHDFEDADLHADLDRFTDDPN